MAKQGERYDPKTKTGWKFENGQSNYYVKGKKLSQIEIVKRGLAQGGENIKGFASDVFSPLTSGAQTLKAKMTRDPRSSIGDNVWTHNKKLLALQAQLDKDPKVIANQQALAASQSPAEFFGTNQYGDRNTQITNEIQASNSSRLGELKIGIDGEIDPALQRALGLETGQMMDGQNFVPTTYEPGSVNQAYANTSSATEPTGNESEVVTIDEKEKKKDDKKDNINKKENKEDLRIKRLEKLISEGERTDNYIPSPLQFENETKFKDTAQFRKIQKQLEKLQKLQIKPKKVAVG